jgi:hypothetical protein
MAKKRIRVIRVGCEGIHGCVGEDHMRLKTWMMSGSASDTMLIEEIKKIRHKHWMSGNDGDIENSERF